MNKIKINRMLLAGLVTLVVWILAEILLEGVIGSVLFGHWINQYWLQTKIPDWRLHNHILNILIALTNCIVLIWLYASLRPMFGVGTRTVLITCGVLVLLTFTMTLNGINLGLFPAKVGLLEWFFESIEFPIAMVAGAYVYEGASEPVTV